MSNKDVMRQMLKDVIETFSKNPSKTRSTNDIRCQYFPDEDKRETSPGCAIGMYIPWKDEVKFKGTIINGLSIKDLISCHPKLIPSWMHKLDKMFLTDLQSLHDIDLHWSDEEGLTKKGKEWVEIIKTRYNL